MHPACVRFHVSDHLEQYEGVFFCYGKDDYIYGCGVSTPWKIPLFFYYFQSHIWWIHGMWIYHISIGLIKVHTSSVVQCSTTNATDLLCCSVHSSQCVSFATHPLQLNTLSHGPMIGRGSKTAIPVCLFVGVVGWYPLFFLFPIKQTQRKQLEYGCWCFRSAEILFCLSLYI